MREMSGKDGGWVLPETIHPENEICVTLNIPDEPRYISAFWGALYELTYWNNWKRDPDHKGAQVAAVWKTIWLHYSSIMGECEDMACCPEPLKRMLPNGTMQTSTDGGLTWQDTPSADPRETSIQFPPLPGEDGAIKQCQAAENIVSIFQSNVEQFEDDLGVVTSIAGVVASIVSLIAVFLSAGALLPAVTFLAAALWRAGASGVSAAFTSDVWERFTCNLYCVMSPSGQLTASDLDAIKAQVDEDETGVAAEVLKHLIDNYGIVGMNNLAATQSTGVGDTCSECECPDEIWCVHWDFTETFEALEVWNGTLTSEGVKNTFPVVVGGIDYFRASVNAFATLEAGSRITSFAFGVVSSGDRGSLNDTSGGMYALDGQSPSSAANGATGLETTTVIVDTTSLDWDGDFQLQFGGDGIGENDTTVVSLTVTGTGVKPTEWLGIPDCV